MKLIKWIFRLLLAFMILCALFVTVVGLYSLSGEDGAVSGQRSSRTTEILKELVSEQIQKSPKAMEVAQKVKEFVIEHSPYKDDWNANVRKAAHFSIYFLIASLIYLIFSVLKIPLGPRWILTILICAVIACFDEAHQGSVDGRMMSAMDMAIDTAGAFAASTLYFIFGKLTR